MRASGRMEWRIESTDLDAEEVTNEEGNKLLFPAMLSFKMKK